MRLSLVTACASIAATTAAAAGGSWAQEPSAVFGVELGADLKATTLLPCDSQLSSTNGAPCYVGGLSMSDRVLRVLATPSLAVAYRASVWLHAGRIEALRLSLSPSDFGLMLRTLEERYGPAQSRRVATLRTGAGAELESQEFIWIGSAVTIVAREHSGRIDEAAVTFTHRPTQDAAIKARDAAASAAAGRL